MSLTLALILDALLGEPKQVWSRVPHPAVLMGRLIDYADTRTNHGDNRRMKGLALMVILVVAAYLLGRAIEFIPGIWADVLVGAVMLAHKSLVDHVRAVSDALVSSLSEGRRAVAQIVGRDVSGMDEPAVARSAIESAAENFSDGVLAPALWFALLGVPGILIYKISNTADSMIGYRTPRHEDFGWAAARFDDLLNWPAARLTAALFLLAGRVGDGWATIAADARLHRSVNAGWPEAAMSRALGVALSGPRAYHGEMRDFPWVNEQGRRTIGPAEIDAAVTLLWRAWIAVLAISAVLWFLFD